LFTALLSCLGLGARGVAAEPATPMAMQFADLAHYAAANRALAPPASGERRVVFIGDSITQSWGDVDRDYFARRDRINRGISGQVTSQMLLRFRQDVIELKPAVVHILAGINDVAQNAGPMDLEVIEGNLASMMELARGLEPGPKILALNDWLAAYARSRDIVFVDYYSAMTDGALGMRAALATDGVHPTPAGYRVMLPLAEAGIAAALRQGTQRR